MKLLIRILVATLVLFGVWVAHPAEIKAATCTVPNTFANGTVIQAAAFNQNFASLVSCGNSIDDTNIGPAGILTSQVNGPAGTSTVSRTLPAFLANTIYGADYGMKCDGVTDDAPAFNAAETAAAAAGAHLVINEGTSMCIFGSAGNIPTNSVTTIYAYIKLKNAANVEVLAVNAAANAVINGTGTLDGNKAHVTGCPNGCAGINSDTPTNTLLVDGLNIVNTGNWALNLSGVNVRVSNVTINNSGSAPEFSACTECFADHMNVQNTGDNGWAFYGNDHYCGITNSYFQGNLSGPIVLNDTGQPTPSDHIVIANNLITQSTFIGMGVVDNTASIGTSNYNTSIIFSGNHLFNNITGNGDFLGYGASGVQIIGNSFGKGKRGVVLQQNMLHTLISGNQIFDEGQSGGPAYGMWIGSSSATAISDTMIRDNSFWDDQGSPTQTIAIQGTAGTGLTLLGNSYNGLSLSSLTYDVGGTTVQADPIPSLGYYDVHADGGLHLTSTNPYLFFDGSSAAGPAFTTRSVGEKVILSNTLSGSSSDYAIGLLSNVMWFGVPTTSQTFQFYTGTTLEANLGLGGGIFSCAADPPTAAPAAGNGSTCSTASGGVYVYAGGWTPLGVAPYIEQQGTYVSGPSSPGANTLHLAGWSNVSVGTTDVTLTFAKAYGAVPTCSVGSHGTNAVFLDGTPTTASVIVKSGSGTIGVDVNCQGHQ